MTTVSELFTPDWPVLTPQAQRLLDRIAPKFKPGGMLVMGPLPPNISNAPKPPRLELYQRELELGEVVHFKPDKGFGHIDTQDGHLFFHVSGYRVPSVHEYKDDSRPGTAARHILQLERLPKVTDDVIGVNVPRLCVPPIASGDAILFLSGSRTGPNNEIKKLAQFWTIQKPYQHFLTEQQSLHEEMLEQWVRLARYKLTLRVADMNTLHAVVPLYYFSTLFEGTETSMLKDWYQHFRDLLNLNEHRTIVLACSEYDESLGSHGPYVDQEPEVTEEFLG